MTVASSGDWWWINPIAPGGIARGDGGQQWGLMVSKPYSTRGHCQGWRQPAVGTDGEYINPILTVLWHQQKSNMFLIGCHLQIQGKQPYKWPPIFWIELLLLYCNLSLFQCYLCHIIHTVISSQWSLSSLPSQVKILNGYLFYISEKCL